MLPITGCSLKMVQLPVLLPITAYLVHPRFRPESCFSGPACLLNLIQHLLRWIKHPYPYIWKQRRQSSPHHPAVHHSTNYCSCLTGAPQPKRPSVLSPSKEDTIHGKHWQVGLYTDGERGCSLVPTPIAANVSVIDESTDTVHSLRISMGYLPGSKAHCKDKYKITAVQVPWVRARVTGLTH
jgi:hypothetical protein